MQRELGSKHLSNMEEGDTGKTCSVIISKSWRALCHRLSSSSSIGSTLFFPFSISLGRKTNKQLGAYEIKEEPNMPYINK